MNAPTQRAGNDTPRPAKHDEALLDREMDEICLGLCEAIDREVARLRREGLPIWVEENGKVVDLQQRWRDANL